MEIFDGVTETLLVLPKSSLSIELKVRAYDEYNESPVFKEYTDHRGRSNLRLNSSEYLSLVFCSKDRTLRESVSVSYLHMATFKNGFEEIKKFVNESFVHHEGSEIFSVDPCYANGYKLENLINDKSIMVLPSIETKENGEQELGCRIIINRPECSGFINFDVLCQFCEFIKNFDLYSASKSLLSIMLCYSNYGPPGGNTKFRSKETAVAPQIPQRK